MRMVEKSNKKLDSFQSDPSLSILIKTELEEAYNLKKTLLTETKYLEKIQEICQVCIHAYRNNHKVLVAGNGGSAADAKLNGFYFGSPI
nr:MULTISPECIES: hypothetical protein [unclassified Microcystis]